MTLNFLRRFVPFQAVALLLAAMVAGPAWAAVGVRVEGRPISNPIQAYVRVTDANGAVAGLNQTHFALTLNGVPLPQLQMADVTLPPDQSNQKVSVAFVMDYTSSVTNNYLAEMESSVIAFINAMNVGDYAAIIKFNNDQGALVMHPFIEIDQDANNDSLAAVVADAYAGDGSNIIDAANVAVDHLTTQLPLLPAGPKAVILFTDGRDSHSSITAEEVIGAANGNSIPIFTIGVGNPNQSALNLLTDLATQTGGEFIAAPTAPDISDAYVSISELLKGEYLLTIPLSITDPITLDGCDVHTMDVTVASHGSASAEFTRRACDTAPNAFSFTNQTGVARNTPVTSNTVTITGIEVPAAISITIGSYSVGCTDTFTSAPGTITDGQTVCIQQTSSQSFSTTRVSTLTVGGVSGTFSTTTLAEGNGGGGGGGGGGATGALEMLLGLAALFARRRRLA